MTLRDILTGLHPDVLLSDGATDWNPDYLMDAIKDGDRPEQLDDEYLYDRGRIYRVGDDGYLVEPAEFHIVEHDD